MKQTTIAIVLLLFIASCNNCKDDSCPPNAFFRYQLVNTDGENLYTIEENDYNEENLKIIGFKGTEELPLYSKLSGNSISLEVAPIYDSIQVIYNDNNKDTFIVKNIKYRDFECCGTIVDDFDIEKDSQDLCTSCGEKTWTIQK